MTKEEMIELAKQSGWQYAHGESGFEPLWAFAKLVAEHEREACANIADKLPCTYRETKEAHERATLEPFHPSKFGFDFAEMRQAEVITHAIRARGEQHEQFARH
jgi:hypothetical protein